MPRLAQSTLELGFAAIFVISVALLHVTSPRAQVPLVATGCRVTQPTDPPFLPPKPYSQNFDPQSFWFGTDELWTYLPADGTWRGLPHYTPDDPTYRQKLFFWSKDFNAHIEPRPNLLITGKRLDGAAPPLMSDRANAGWKDPGKPFIVTAINLPTLGCWQITARYKSAILTFVVHVTQSSPTL